MTLRQRIISEIYDERDNKVVDGRIIEDKKIETPVKIDDLGYNHQEQIKDYDLLCYNRPVKFAV